ncbi:MAG: Bbp16 family capsid cement protein [Gemmataceae bacterium]
MYTEQMTQGLSIAGNPIHPQSLASGSPTGTGGIDMSKFRRALFILDVGAFGAGATVDMKLQESTDNATWTDLAGTGVSIAQLAVGGGNNRLATLEARAGQLTKRYLRALVTVGTAATQVACLALGGEAVSKPGNQNDVAAVAQRSVVS